MTSTIERKAILSGAAVLGLFLIIGGVQYRTILGLVRSQRLVSHTLEVIENLTRLQYALSGTENAAREFADSGRKADLDSYRSAAQQSRLTVVILSGLTADNTSQQARIARMSPLVNSRLDALDQFIAVHGTEAGDENPVPAPAEARNAEVNQIIAEMKDEEHRLLNARNERAALDQRQTVALLAAGSLLGIVIAVLGAGRLRHDLVERRRADEALKSSEERFRTLAQTAHDAIVFADSRGMIVFWNRGAQQIFGYSADEALGQPLQVLVPDRFQLPYRQGLEQYLALPANRLVPGTAELLGRKKDGSEFPIDLSYGAWMAGGEIFFTALMRDLTERRQTEQGLRELSGRVLRLQDEERSRLARELHDGTSQALAAMQIHVATLDRVISSENDAARESLRELESLVSSASSEVRTLTHLLHPPLLEQTGLSEAIRWYAEGFSKRSGIKVAADIDASLPRLNPELERALFRIVQETLANIHRHSGSRTAEIELKLKDGCLALEIKDHGRGIAPEVLRTPARWGVGIRGMRERVRLLGGELEIHADGAGTTLRASLPVELPAHEQV